MNNDHDAWSEREDDALLEACFIHQTICVAVISKQLGRDPVQALMRVLDSEAPEMAGWGDTRCPDQDAEFLGLTLSGVPIGVALQWCSVTHASDQRPTHAELVATMSRADLRPAVTMAMSLGLWFTRASQIPALEFLATQPLGAVQDALNKVIDRVDALTPEIVAQQLFGALPYEMPVKWQTMGGKAPCAVKFPRRSRYARKTTGTARSSARTGHYKKGRTGFVK